jgi:hypothetical protein
MPYLLVLVLLGASALGNLYYNTKLELEETKAVVVTLKANQEKLEYAIEVQKEEMERKEADYKLQTEALNQMTLKSQEIQQEMSRYLDIFKRHNLTKLAIAKPGLIEKRANKGTKDVFDSIETDSSFVDKLDD